MILFSFLILIQGTYQISKVDLKVKYVNDSKAFSLSPAYYEALYDFYSYELTNDNDKNAEKNALGAFQETFIGNISKYINFDLRKIDWVLKPNMLITPLNVQKTAFDLCQETKKNCVFLIKMKSTWSHGCP